MEGEALCVGLSFHLGGVIIFLVKHLAVYQFEDDKDDKGIQVGLCSFNHWKVLACFAAIFECTPTP